jgi:hypothetical protein
MTSGSTKSTSNRPDAAPLKRRGVLLAGAGAAGAAGAAVLAAKGLPSAQSTPVASAAPAPDKQPGYQLTQHVRRYYETAKV